MEGSKEVHLVVVLQPYVSDLLQVAGRRPPVVSRSVNTQSLSSNLYLGPAKANDEVSNGFPKEPASFFCTPFYPFCTFSQPASKTRI